MLTPVGATLPTPVRPRDRELRRVGNVAPKRLVVLQRVEEIRANTHQRAQALVG